MSPGGQCRKAVLVGATLLQLSFSGFHPHQGPNNLTRLYNATKSTTLPFDVRAASKVPGDKMSKHYLCHQGFSHFPQTTINYNPPVFASKPTNFPNLGQSIQILPMYKRLYMRHCFRWPRPTTWDGPYCHVFLLYGP